MYGYKRFSAALIVSAMLAGCASQEPIRLQGAAAADYDAIAVLWTRSSYINLFERQSDATVTGVDGQVIKEGRTAYGPPIELPPGKHVVTLRYDRASLFIAYFGPVFFRQSDRSVTAEFEAGYSYMSFSRISCGRDWFWIVDTGHPGRDDVATWRKSGRYRFEYDVNADLKKGRLTVVGGAMPPADCNEARD